MFPVDHHGTLARMARQGPACSEMAKTPWSCHLSQCHRRCSERHSRFQRFSVAIFCQRCAPSARRRDGIRRATPSAMGWPDRPPPWTRPPRPPLIRVSQKYLGPKIPKVRGFAIALLATPHRLFRFLAGDHYGKGKSIRDDSWTCESGLTKCFMSVGPRLKSSWRGWGPLPWLCEAEEAH